MNVQELLEEAERRSNALVMMYQGAAPHVVVSTEGLDDWSVFAPAYVARCAYLLQSIMCLKEREVDANVLTRTLWEHVVTFAWVAIEPTERLQMIVANDKRRIIAASEDVRRFTGSPLFPDGDRTEFKAYVDRYPGLPPIDQMAQDADRYWSAQLPGSAVTDAGEYSLRAAYAYLFRQFSAYTHPTTMGLVRFKTPGPGDLHEIGQTPPDDEDVNCIALAPLLFAQLLLMTAHALRWPSASQVYAICALDMLSASRNP